MFIIFSPLYTDVLHPIYFKRYDSRYIPQKSELKELQKKYGNFYPLIELDFRKGIISIRMRGDAEVDIVVTYKFDKKTNDWYFEKSEEYYKYYDNYSPIDLSNQLGPSISNFTYFYGEE